jgi:hypothetical protein
MTKREMERVARYIARLDGIEVTGTRVYRVRGGASYELACTDTRTGVQFVVRSQADIDERVADAAFDWGTVDGLLGQTR